MHQQFYYAVPKTGCEKLAWATNSDWRLSELTPTLCKNQRSKEGLLAPLPFSGIVFHCMWRPVGEIASTLITPVICNHNCPPTGCKNGCSGLWLRWNERAEWEQRIEGVFYEGGGGTLATWDYYWRYNFKWEVSLIFTVSINNDLILIHLTKICLCIWHKCICIYFFRLWLDFTLLSK